MANPFSFRLTGALLAFWDLSERYKMAMAPSVIQELKRLGTWINNECLVRQVTHRIPWKWVTTSDAV